MCRVCRDGFYLHVKCVVCAVCFSYAGSSGGLPVLCLATTMAGIPNTLTLTSFDIYHNEIFSGGNTVSASMVAGADPTLF